MELNHEKGWKMNNFGSYKYSCMKNTFDKNGLIVRRVPFTCDTGVRPSPFRETLSGDPIRS